MSKTTVTIPPKNARILLVRLSSIGDVLHTTAIAHQIKQYLPDCHLTWLVSPPAATLLENNPDIDRLLVWDRRPIDKAGASLHLGTCYAELKKAAALLHQYEFDIALDVQGLFLTGILTRMSRAKRRIGIHERHEGNSLFMSEMAPEIDDPHKIRRYLTALRPLGYDPKKFRPGLVLKLKDGWQDYARKFWQKHGVDPSRPILFVNTRTTWPDKNWKPEYFGEALRELPPLVQIVFCGAPADIPFVKTAQQNLFRPSVSIAGETNLRELAALFKTGTLLLTGDTGPLYIAEAVGLSTLSLWGPTHPTIYGPLSAGHRFIITPNECRACCHTHCKKKTNACMDAIPPSVVAERLREIFY